VKETFSEFKEYVKHSKIKVKQEECPESNEEDGDDDDNEDNDVIYQPDDFKIVEPCVSYIFSSLESLNLSLQVMTLVGDTSTSRSPTSHDDSVFSASIHSSYCQVWVAKISSLSCKIQDAVIDLGSELYPPLDDLVTISNNCNKLLDWLRLLKSYLCEASAREIISNHEPFNSQVQSWFAKNAGTLTTDVDFSTYEEGR